MKELCNEVRHLRCCPDPGETTSHVSPVRPCDGSCVEAHWPQGMGMVAKVVDAAALYWCKE